MTAKKKVNEVYTDVERAERIRPTTITRALRKAYTDGQKDTNVSFDLWIDDNYNLVLELL